MSFSASTSAASDARRLRISVIFALVAHAGIASWALGDAVRVARASSAEERVILVELHEATPSSPGEDEHSAGRDTPSAPTTKGRPPSTPSIRENAARVVRASSPIASAAESPAAVAPSAPSNDGDRSNDGDAASERFFASDGSSSEAPGDGTVSGDLRSAGRGPDSTGKGNSPRTSGHAVARGPRLIATGDACRGVFPNEADDDSGVVTLALQVSQSGKPRAPRVLQEFPRGQGFAKAAHACVARLRFEPAADLSGTPIASRSTVRLRFARN